MFCGDVPFFDPQEEMFSLTRRLIRRDLFDDEILRRLFDDAADARKINREVGERIRLSHFICFVEYIYSG